MKKQLTIALSLIAMFLVIGCSQPTLIGKWQAKNADVKNILGEVLTDESVNLKSANVDMTVTDKTITMEVVASVSATSDGVSMDMDVEYSVEYTYEREGDNVKLHYVSHKANLKDLKFDSAVTAALEAQGITTELAKTEMQKMMQESMEKDESAKKDDSFVIKSLEANTLTIEDSDGKVDFIRVN